jgi:oxygen-independent coproporphyrinogen-3 oxidase
MGMRLNEGVDLQRHPDVQFDILYKNINRLSEIGMIILADSRLKVTPLGRPVLNAVLRGLLDA